MKKFLFLILPLLSCLLFSTNLFAQNFYGWWKCFSGGSEVGDFTTGEWIYEKVTYNKGSYLYIGNNNEAYLIQWNDSKGFYLENAFTFHERNNILILRGLSDEGGDLSFSSTAILKTSLPHPYPNKIVLTYTRYDLRKPDDRDDLSKEVPYDFPYVKKFNLIFTRVRDITKVPEEVKRLTQ